MKPRVLVTGASGALGPLLVRGLVKEGYPVKAMVRRKVRPHTFPQGVTTVHGDITRKSDVMHAVADVDIVYHLAAKLHINDPGALLENEYSRTNVDGTRLICRASADAGVTRIVYFSTISVYGSQNGYDVIDETTEPTPLTVYGMTKKAAEDIVLGLENDAQRVEGVVLRLAAVYGSRMKGNYRTLLSAVRKGWFLPVGPGLNRRTLVHESDVVRAAMVAAIHPRAAGGVFNVTDGEVHTLRGILNALYESLGKPGPRWYVPEPLARHGARIADRVLQGAGYNGGRLETFITKYTEDVAVSGDKFIRELAFTPLFDLRGGWKETASGVS